MKSSGLLSIGLILIPAWTAAATLSVGNTAKAEEAVPQYVFDACLAHETSCVIDLTAKRICPKITQPRAGSLANTLDGFIADCPQYKWRKDGGVYVVESRDEDDTALTTTVGPFLNEELDASTLFSRMWEPSGLRLERPNGLTDRRWPYDNVHRPLKVPVPIGKMPFKAGMIAAAKLYAPSVWEVYRVSDKAFFRDIDSVGARQPPQQYLLDVCRKHRMTCVVDLTSTNICTETFLTKGTGFVAGLNMLIRKCPQYKWRKVENIYVVESSTESDSVLTTEVGPIKGKRVDIPGILNEFSAQAGFPLDYPRGFGGMGLVDGSIPPFKKYRISLPRKPFKANMIEAARQIQPAVLGVYRLDETSTYGKGRAFALLEDSDRQASDTGK